MPSFSDIAQHLGEMATGLTVGTMEREQADRAEARQLTDTAISRGAQGIDYAPFFTPDQFRPANADVLQRLQQASGPVGPGVSGEGMLQYPHAQQIQLQAEREQAARTFTETSTAERERFAEEQLNRREAAALERQNQRQVRARNSLNPSEWNAVRGIEAAVVDNALASQTPDYWVPGQTGVAVAPQYAAARASIIRALEMRIPQHIVFDPGSIRDLLSEHFQDISRGITVTPPSGWGLMHPFGGTTGSIQYSEAAATPRRADSSGASVGAGTVTNPAGTTVAPAPGAQVGRSTAPEQARTQRTLEQWGPQITSAAQEFGLPPQLLAATFGVGEGGQMVQGPIIPNRTERAFGVAQVLPSTYNQVARELREGRPITDPAANIRVGTAYFAKQMRDYNGDVALALAAYNWGPGNLNAMMHRFPDGVSRSVLFQNMPRETVEYIDRIGRGLGGWDNATMRTALPGMPSGQGAPRTQPQGTPTGNVTQRAPTAQEAASVNQYIDLTVRNIATSVTSITDVTRRYGALEAALTSLPDSVRRNYSPALVDHIVAEVRRQLHGVT